MGNLAGRTIKLFLVDGIPDGIRTAEIMSWTGHVLFAPRSSVAALIARPEAKRTGAYLLIGPNPEDADQVMVYVGEGDNVGVRISSHNKDDDKDFWEQACIITSKDLNLTKAHARYLESELIRIVKNEGRATLANRSLPEFDLLPESDLADMDDFVARLQVLLPVLGADFVRPTPDLRRTETRGSSNNEEMIGQKNEESGESIKNSSNDIRPEFRMNAGGLRAEAIQVDGQMIVRAGSQARVQEAPSLASNVRAYRDQLIKAGKLVKKEDSDNFYFADDVAFTSPSAAAQAVMGTSRNGRTDWINAATNETYANWQDRLISELSSTVGFFDENGQLR